MHSVHFSFLLYWFRRSTCSPIKVNPGLVEKSEICSHNVYIFLCQNGRLRSFRMVSEWFYGEIYTKWGPAMVGETLTTTCEIFCTLVSRRLRTCISQLYFTTIRRAPISLPLIFYSVQRQMGTFWRHERIFCYGFLPRWSNQRSKYRLGDSVEQNFGKAFNLKYEICTGFNFASSFRWILFWKNLER